MPLSSSSHAEFFFLLRPHLASKSLSQPLLPSLKNVSYSLWGSHPRKIDGDEGPGAGDSEGAISEKGRWGLAPCRIHGCLLWGQRMLLANIKLGPSIHPHSPERANSVDGLEKRGLEKLNSFRWKCEMTLCHRRKVAANEDFFCSRRSKEAGRELFHIWDAVCNSWITFFFWLTASHNAGFHHMKSHSREFWAIFSFYSFSKPHPSPNLHSSFPLSGFE